MEKTKGNFYPHNMEESRNSSSKRDEKAQSQPGVPILVEPQILHLIEIAENGLPDCYESFDDFLFDFWMDFTWNAEKSIEEAKAVFKDPRIKKVIPILNVTWDIDMEEILTVIPTMNQF